MLARRLIPCLDVAGGRVVKGVHFRELRDAGDPVEQAARYDAAGADEVVLLDIGASPEERGTLIDLVSRVADRLFVPFTVGGGIRSVADARQVLRAGADKVGVNTAAVRDPSLVTRLADGLEAVEWVVRLQELGAGEILLTSMDTDGTQHGYDLPVTRAVARAVRLPVIASGGAGALEHLAAALDAGAHGVLAATLFHYRGTTIPEARAYLASRGYPVRP